MIKKKFPRLFPETTNIDFNMCFYLQVSVESIMEGEVLKESKISRVLYVVNDNIWHPIHNIIMV